MNDFADSIIETGKTLAAATTAVLRHATFVSLSGEEATIEMGGGQVKATMMFTGQVPAPGAEVLVLQQGYELVVAGPIDVFSSTDADALYVKKTGDTMSGDLTVDKANAILTASAPSGTSRVVSESDASSALLEARSPAGQEAALYLRTGTTLRWRVYKTTTAESGGDAGSDFAISRHSDAGASLGFPVSISRKTGLVSVSGLNSDTIPVAGMRTAKIGRFNGPASATGYIIIEFPASLMSTMATLRITGYNYVSGQGEWTAVIGGYLYSGNPNAYWGTPSVQVSGADRVAAAASVRLLAKGGTAASDQRFAIAIGEVGSTWAYPQVHVEIDAGFSTVGGATALNDTATISIGTDISSWTNVVTPTVNQTTTKAYADTKAPLNSPALTGTPTAPTPAVGDNDTSIATTAFVNAEIANDAPTKTGGGASGTWGISITGNADTVDGLHAHATESNQTSANQLVRTQSSGYTMLGYINSSSGNEGGAAAASRVWGTNGSDSYLRSYLAAYQNAGHSHTRTGAGYNLVAFDVGTLAANTTYGPWTVAHGLGQTPGVSMSDAYGDDGVHSIDTSIGTHDSVNCNFTAKNNNDSNEACSLVGAHFK